MAVIDEIAAERARQIDGEGYGNRHDDLHTDGELAAAASCYAYEATPFAKAQDNGRPYVPPIYWPVTWSSKHWKPRSPREDLIRAGALIVAEIERLDRLAPTAPGAPL